MLPEPIKITRWEWRTLRSALAIHQYEIRKRIRRAVKAKNPRVRPSELAMEAADVRALFDKIREYSAALDAAIDAEEDEREKHKRDLAGDAP